MLQGKKKKKKGRKIERAKLYEVVYSHKDCTTVTAKAEANIVSIIQMVYGEILYITHVVKCVSVIVANMLSYLFVSVLDKDERSIGIRNTVAG